MILVDTSVWVDHLNAPDATMTARLRTNDVLMHSMVIGELACGNLRAREARIADLKGVQGIAELGNDVVITRIEEHNLMGRGLGFVDAHLICAVLEEEGACLWTRDRRPERSGDRIGRSVRRR